MSPDSPNYRSCSTYNKPREMSVHSGTWFGGTVALTTEELGAEDGKDQIVDEEHGEEDNDAASEMEEVDELLLDRG